MNKVGTIVENWLLKLLHILVETIIKPALKLITTLVVIGVLTYFGWPYIRNMLPHQTSLTNEIIQQALLPIG